MRIYYSHKTALRFWQQPTLEANPERYTPVSLSARSVSRCLTEEIVGRIPILDLDIQSNAALDSHNPSGVAANSPSPLHSNRPEQPSPAQNQSGPIEAMWPQTIKRKNTKSIVYHHFDKNYPKGAFLALDSHVAIACPELTYIQSLNNLDLIERVLLGNLFCAGFKLVDQSVDQRGFCSCEPLSSAEKITSLLNRLPQITGLKACRQTLKYLVNNAASPREVQLAMLLTLPRKVGGFGFPVPELNATIALDRAQQRVISRGHLSVDMLWRKEKVVVEYDSDQWHTAKDKITYDSRRRNLLKSMGYEVITVTNEEIKHPADMAKVAEAIAKMLHCRLRIRRSEFEIKRRELHRYLMSVSMEMLQVSSGSWH